MKNSKKNNLFPSILIFLIFFLFMVPYCHAIENFSLNGYLMNQTGIFISADTWSFREYKTTLDSQGFYTDHGDKRGKLSMFRNTFQLEGEWQPHSKLAIHGIFRAVRSSRLDVDKEAQMPSMEITDPVGWVHDRYYTEAGMRELYLDFDISEYLNIRAGRQQVSWGETGQYRLLDAINPIDPTWHFASLESFEDIRIPLWIIKFLFEVRRLNGDIEAVWVPALDDPEDMVTVPLTLVGAWGLPRPNRQLNQPSNFKIKNKIFKWPENDIENSRFGFRWKGVLGDFNYTLVYYYTHILSPPITEYFIWKQEEENLTPPFPIDVYVGFPRQHLMGFSMEYTFSSPIWTVARLEATLEPNRVYPLYSKEPVIKDPSYSGPGVKYLFQRAEKTVLNYALVLTRPTFVRFINPRESIVFVGQFMHSYITDFDKDEHVLDITGYDSTESKKHDMRLIYAMRTNYLHGCLVPSLTAVYLFSGNTVSEAFKFEQPSGFIANAWDILIGNNWRITPSFALFFGDNPYRGIGLYRDRDEINLKIKYQF